MAIRIVTDSAADFTREELAASNIQVIPLQVIFGEESYVIGETLSRDEYWARMIAGEAAKTSQPSPEAVLSVFEEAKAAGDTVIYICLSSGLSGTMQSALLYKSMAEYDDIYVVDSLSATVGQKLLTLTACRLRDKGKLSAAQIVAQIEALRSRVRIFATVDTLEYLARGGRISKTAANIGTLAQLKPQILVSQEGKVEVCGKAIGRHRAIESLVKRVTCFAIDDAYPVIPVYSYAPENLQAFLKKLSASGVAYSEELLSDLGAVIGTHIGPNAYGICFVEKQ